MASLKEFKPTYDSSILKNSDGTWMDWNNQAGSSVQLFIKGELERAIVDFEYKDSTLIGKNSLGQEVVAAEVNVIKPDYFFECSDSSMDVTLNNASAPISGIICNVNANSSLTAKVKFNWNLVQKIGDKRNDYASNTIKYRVYLTNDTGTDKYRPNGTEIVGQASYNTSGLTLDISKLLSKAEILTGTVRVAVELSFSFINEAGEVLDTSCSIISPTKLNVKRIELSYTSTGLLKSKTLTFGLSGISSEDADSFKLKYGVLVKGTTSDSVQSFELALDKEDVSLVNLRLNSIITEDVQSVNICARVINNDSTLFSDWITVSTLYQSDSTISGLSGATVVVSDIPESVSNCDSANLFSVLTTDKMLGEMTVYVYKANTESVLLNISKNPKDTNYYKKDSMMQYLFKTINMSLNGAEVSKVDKYFSYLEMEGINDDNNTIYLAFVVQTGSDETNAEVSTFCVPTSTGKINSKKVRAIKITNPKNASELMHVAEGKIIDYSQIVANKKFDQDGTPKELFAKDNLHPNIDNTDGMTLDGKYMGFKVSPLGLVERNSMERPFLEADPKYEPTPKYIPINLFKKPIALKNTGGTLLANTSEFSIELLIKTYNVNNDDDFILSIGNLRLYPHYLRLWSLDLGYANGDIEFSTPYIASCANFSKDEITHIMITFNTSYKPKRYMDTLYKDLYPGFEKNPENGGPQPAHNLKIYINGVINRSISIDSSLLLDQYGDFSLQIHPTNSNINIYGLRTYNKCLDYDLILKNRISAFASLEDEKLPFLEVNDLLHKSSDYTTDRWAEIYEAGLANTISIKKCLGITDLGYVDKTKKYNPKNVILMVVGDEGPLYYGNKKFADPLDARVKLKYHDAAMFVKYAHSDEQALDYLSKYNGKFIGIYQAHENGYAEYYKALGSSAKRYGGAYNVQFAKFYFIPETKLSLFAKLVDNQLYVEGAPTWEETTEEIDGSTVTTYKTGVKLEFNKAEYNQRVVEKGGKYSYKLFAEAGTDSKYPKSYNTVMEKLATKKYVLPTDGSNALTKKLVGKVNYASSMQSHKEGACELYAGCYPESYINNKETLYDYMKRRAVKEDVFYYFFIKLSDCQLTKEQKEKDIPVSYRNVTWDNIVWDKIRFFGIQTWGSAKMDKDTFGLLDDIDLEYLNIEGADNKNSSTNFKCPWAAQLIWDNPDLTERDDPYYTSIAGKKPEEYVTQFAGYITDDLGEKIPNYTRALLIDDETIRYKLPSLDETGSAGADAIEKGPDSWDVAGNAVEETESSHFEFIKWGDDFVDTENKTHKPITPIVNSFNSFAEMYNAIYALDFGNLELLVYKKGTTIAKDETDETILEKEGDPILSLSTSIKGISESKKYVVVQAGELDVDGKIYNVNTGDVFRYDLLFQTFVPAGLYYTDKEWETFNLGKEYSLMIAAINGDTSSKYYKIYSEGKKNYEDYVLEGDFFEKPKNLLTPGEMGPLYFNEDADSAENIASDLGSKGLNRENALALLLGAFADMFKCAIWAYFDVNSLAYHLAAIRFLSGTDNRAKNIYFVLKGNTYIAKTAIDKVTGEEKTYYEVNPDLKAYKNRYLWTLFQDDLDTIFATDNNGQLSKDYNLLEPIYNNETIGNWGDSRSGLFYNFDLVFELEIKQHLKRIVDWALNTGAAVNGEVYNESNNLYKSFLKIQKEIIPAVTYNHMSEIYYDTMLFVYLGGAVTPFGKTVDGFNDGVFNNNLVSNPESLVHGGCFESEKQFLKKRVALLASYCSDFKSEDTYSNIKPLGKTGGGDLLKIYMKMKDLSFILDFYPNILGNTINDYNRPYADPVVLTYNSPAYLTALAREGDPYEIARFNLASGLTSRDSVYHTDYYRTVTFTEGVSSVDEFAMNNVSELRYLEPDYDEDGVPVSESGKDPITLSDDDKGINFKPINIDKDKPILYMDKIVKNVEVLDAPYSKFDKSTIDLSQCQRLKELNLSKATSTVTIANILLPKSNKLSKVTLPSDIKQISIEYYPGITHFNPIEGIEIDKLTWFRFDSDNVNLTSITIDMRNTWAIEFLEKYAKRGVIENVVLKNTPENLDITVSMLSVLVELDKFDFDSKVSLRISGNVDMILKSKMAKKWGDIDNSSNRVSCVYDSFKSLKISFDDASPTIGSTGQTIGFSIVDINDNNANDIKIKGDGLWIEYSMVSVPGTSISINSSTGEFTIPKGTNILDKSTTVNIRVYKTDGTNFLTEIKVYFGTYKPTAGDIVYSDGSFGKTINPNKTPIGFIFWSKLISWLPKDAPEVETSASKHTSETYDIRIMAFDCLRSVNKLELDENKTFGLPFGPSNITSSTINLSYGNYGDLDATALDYLTRMFTGPEFFANFTKANDMNDQNPLGIDRENFPKPTGINGYITVNSTIPDSGSNANLYCGYYTTKNAHDFVYRKDNSQRSTMISRIKKQFNTFPYDDLTKDNYDTIYTWLSNNLRKVGLALFPGYVKTYEWKPNGVDSEKSPEIGEGKWYIPSSLEYAYLISEKLKQLDDGTVTGADYREDWGKSGEYFYQDQKLRKVKDNIFRTLLENMKATTLDAFSGINISFIKNGISLLKSSTSSSDSYTGTGSDSNNVYAYESRYNAGLGGNNYTSGWYSTISSYYGSGGPALSTRAIIYPCCRIIKEIELS